MGARGPKPKPTDVRVLEGNAGRLPINGAEPQPKGAAEPPDYLSEYAGTVWRRIQGSMPPELYKACDAELLAAYCETAAAHRGALIALRENRNLFGETELVADGKPSPYLRIAMDAARTLATLGTRLGLSPADRTGIKLPGQDQEGGKWSGLLA